MGNPKAEGFLLGEETPKQTYVVFVAFIHNDTALVEVEDVEETGS